MRAGDLRHRLLFETLVTGLDSDGAATEDWIDAFAVNSTMPAEVTPLSGRELIAAGATQSKVTHRIKVRFRPGFKANMRASERGVFYNIEAIIPDPKSGFDSITMLATAGVNAGGTALEGDEA